MPAENIDNALSGWDYALRVWAVAGPLLAGAVSAIWSRRNQIQDRDYQNNLQEKRENRLAEESKRIRIEEAKRKRHAELRDACIEFMASSHEYVRKQSEYLTRVTPELHDHAREANDRFTNSNQKLILLGNTELSEASISFWNAAIAMPKSYRIEVDEEYEENLITYQSTRTAFNEAAKRQLSEYEQEI